MHALVAQGQALPAQDQLPILVEEVVEPETAEGSVIRMAMTPILFSIRLPSGSDTSAEEAPRRRDPPRLRMCGYDSSKRAPSV